jgi:hypothetical protein
MADQSPSGSVEQPKSEGGHYFFHPLYKAIIWEYSYTFLTLMFILVAIVPLLPFGSLDTNSPGLIRNMLSTNLIMFKAREMKLSRFQTDQIFDAKIGSKADELETIFVLKIQEPFDHSEFHLSIDKYNVYYVSP